MKTPSEVANLIVKLTGQKIENRGYNSTYCKEEKHIWSNGGKISENGDIAYFDPIPDHYAPHAYFQGKECVQFQAKGQQWTYSSDGFAHAAGEPKLLTDKTNIEHAFNDAETIFRQKIQSLKS